MAAPSHPAILPSGPGKALALVAGGGGQIQPIPVLQNTSQPSVTMVRVVTHPLTSIALNGYSAASLGGAEGNGEFRGTQAVAQLLLLGFHRSIKVGPENKANKTRLTHKILKFNPVHFNTNGQT